MKLEGLSWFGGMKVGGGGLMCNSVPNSRGWLALIK